MSRVKVSTPEKMELGGVTFKTPTSIPGLIVTLILVVFLRFIFWTWLLMVLVGSAGVPWGFWRCAFPFGILLMYLAGKWSVES